MAKPNCPKCQCEEFTTTKLGLGAWVNMVHCADCGAVVGVLDDRWSPEREPAEINIIEAPADEKPAK